MPERTNNPARRRMMSRTEIRAAAAGGSGDRGRCCWGVVVVVDDDAVKGVGGGTGSLVLLSLGGGCRARRDWGSAMVCERFGRVCGDGKFGYGVSRGARGVGVWRGTSRSRCGIDDELRVVMISWVRFMVEIRFYLVSRFGLLISHTAVLRAREKVMCLTYS